MAVRSFLNGETFDPETTRLVGVAFETARAAVNRPADLTDEMIAKKIIELAKAGERNVEGLCEAALNVPTGAVSAPQSSSASRFTTGAAGFFIFVAIEFDEVESIKEYALVSALVTDEIERGNAVVIAARPVKPHFKFRTKSRR